MVRTGEKGRPPPGGIAGAVKARLRGVEPDAWREDANLCPRQVYVYPIRRYGKQGRPRDFREPGAPSPPILAL